MSTHLNDPLSASLNTSLLLRGQTWHLHWHVPARLRHLALFRGKAIYTTTLRTRDVYEARHMRDQLLATFRQMQAVAERTATREAQAQRVAEAAAALAALSPSLSHSYAPTPSPAPSPAAARTPTQPPARTHEAAHDTTHDPDPDSLPAIAREFVADCEGSVSRATLGKAIVAADSLAEQLADAGLPPRLSAVTVRQVTRWINSSEAADNTRRGYLAALQRMWMWAWERERIDGASPFKGVQMQRAGDTVSYAPFTAQEVHQLAETAATDHALRELMRYGLVTGCRISELVELSPASMVIVEGVHCVKIASGKTDAAARAIPLPLGLWETLRGHVEAGLWAGSVTMWSQRFGALKLKATGRKDRTQGFHSFRHMTATAYEREHVEERITSVLLGHKNKRGESMSYGLYSAGLSPQQYRAAVETMLAGDYMQSFLRHL